MKDLGPINGLVPEFPLATTAIAPLRAKAEAQGKGDFSPLWSGQNATGCKEISAAELTRALGGLREALPGATEPVPAPQERMRVAG